MFMLPAKGALPIDAAPAYVPVRLSSAATSHVRRRLSPARLPVRSAPTKTKTPTEPPIVKTTATTTTMAGTAAKPWLMLRGGAGNGGIATDSVPNTVSKPPGSWESTNGDVRAVSADCPTLSWSMLDSLPALPSIAESSTSPNSSSRDCQLFDELDSSSGTDQLDFAESGWLPESPQNATTSGSKNLGSGLCGKGVEAQCATEVSAAETVVHLSV